MDLSRTAYSRDLKIAAMRALDAGSGTGEIARKYQLSPLLHSDVQEKNLESLLGGGKTSQVLRDVAQALDSRIRNALAHGVPAIDLDRRRCAFRDRHKPVDLSFDKLFDQTMRLTMTALCLLSIDPRVQQQWIRQKLDALLRG